jgi:integrase
MKRLNLTQAIVAKLAAPSKGRDVIHDIKTPGLILRVTPNGVKSFYLYRRVNGKPQKHFLGRHPVMTVETARELAVQKYAAIIGGADPNKEKRDARRSGMTIGELWEHFRINRLEPRSSRSTAKSHKSRFDTCLAGLKDRRLDSIRREEVVALHVRLGTSRGQVTANRAVQLLRLLYNYADDKLGITVANPAAKIELFAEHERERYLSAAELPTFFNAIKAEEDETLRDFFLVTLWTGARRGNVLQMRWDQLDLDRAVWKIPGHLFKTRKPLDVALCPEAIEILKRRRKEVAGEWVFPSHGATGHLIEPKSGWERLRQRSGLPNLRIHDLRHTLASWQAASGASLHIIGRSLGHARAETTRRYSHLDLDPIRASVEAAARAISEAAKPKKKGASK